MTDPHVSRLEEPIDVEVLRRIEAAPPSVEGPPTPIPPVRFPEPLLRRVAISLLLGTPMPENAPTELIERMRASIITTPGIVMLPSDIPDLDEEDITKFAADQPRAPKGSPAGGQWTGHNAPIHVDNFNRPLDDFHADPVTDHVMLHHVTSKDIAHQIEVEGFVAGSPNQFQDFPSAIKGTYGWNSYDRAVYEIQRMVDMGSDPTDMAILSVRIPKSHWSHMRPDEDSSLEPTEWKKSYQEISAAYEGDIPPSWITQVAIHGEVAKFAADQPRVPAGNPAGGQWTGAQLLATPLKGPQGSNPGGTYLGADGVKRYVKKYSDPTQAHGEHLANQLYRDLGFRAPDSVVVPHDGWTLHAGVYEPGETLAKLGLTPHRATQILEAFPVDVLTANWDAVGTGLDNVLFHENTPIRIDQGGAFLMRAQAGRKPTALLEKPTEWEGFAPGGVNPHYAKLFHITKQTPSTLNIKPVVQKILALRGEGWHDYVLAHTKGLATKDQAAITSMLEARTQFLAKKAGLSVEKFSDTEPRDPKGSPTGGQWTSEGKPDPFSEVREKVTQFWGDAWDKLGAHTQEAQLQQALNDLQNRVDPFKTNEDALVWYVQDGFEAVNGALRGRAKPKGIEKLAIDRIDEEIARQKPSRRAQTVYRGITGDFVKKIQKLSDGEVVEDKAYTSVSQQRIFAHQFIDSEYVGISDEVPRAMLEIKLPKGTRAVAGLDEESELIIARNGRFKKTGSTVDKEGVSVIRLEYLPPDDVTKFKDDQARAPKGSPTGGQWIATGMGRTTPEGADLHDPAVSVKWRLSAEDPPELNGVPFVPYVPPPHWSKAPGQLLVSEPPLVVPQRPEYKFDPETKKWAPTGETVAKRVSAGAIIQEPDGRVWLFEPLNHYGGYKQTFPKGGQEAGLTLQQTAIKEVWEETGLKVEITGHAMDQERDTTMSRYYWAQRTGGTPTDFGEETHAVHLVPVEHLHRYLNRENDRKLAATLLQAPMPAPAPVVRWKGPGASQASSEAPEGRPTSPWLPKGVHDPTKSHWWEKPKTLFDRFRKGILESVLKFNPSQPRNPKGSPTGGQWAAYGYAPPPGPLGGLPNQPTGGLHPVKHKAQLKKLAKLATLAHAGDLESLRHVYVAMAVEKKYKQELIKTLELQHTQYYLDKAGLPKMPIQHPGDFDPSTFSQATMSSAAAELMMGIAEKALSDVDPTNAYEAVNAHLPNVWSPSGKQYGAAVLAALKEKISPKAGLPEPPEIMTNGKPVTPGVKLKLSQLYAAANGESPLMAVNNINVGLPTTTAYKQQLIAHLQGKQEAGQMTPSTPTVAELMASHKSQGSTPQHAYDALGETFPSLPVNTKIGLVGAYYGPNAEAQLKPNPPATKPVPEPSSVIDNDNKPTFGDLKVMHEMHSVASSPDNTKQAKLDYLHSIHEDTYSNAVGEYKEALLHHLATPVAGLPSNPHNVPPPPIGGSPDMLKLYDAAQHSNPQEAIAQVKAAWIGSKAEAAYSQDLINHLTDVVNGNPQASSDVPPPPTHTVQGWEIGVGSPTGIAYAEMHSLAVEGMKQTTVAGVQAAMSTIHANFPNDLAYKSTLLAHLGNKLTELGDQHPHGIEPFTAMFPRGTLLPGSPATKETKALYEASEQPNAELALEAVVATPAISGYGMQYKDAIIQHLEAKTQNPLSSPQPSGLMPATQAQVTAHLQPKPPKAPVQTGTSSGALWAQNKIQQLTSASNSSDPINAILAVSMTKTTPKYLKKYQADLLAHHQALGTQKGSAAPASTPLSGKIAAVKPKMPPLPDAPPVDTASGKYTPEQQKLYTEKVASLKAAAAGPNPLVAIDKIQGASGAIQTYKSALINHIMAHAPVPDAIIGQTVSSYKIVGEHALPQPAKFKVQSQSSLEHLATYRHNLPPTLRKAVDSYKGSGYQALNAHRFNPGAPLPSHHKALDKALYGGQLDRDTLLTRRISSKALGSIAKSLEGKIFTDPAYGSTSYAEHTWHGNVVLKINAPKGTRGIFFTSEHEWLLPRNTRYRVFKVENTSSGETVIHTELLPPHEQVEIPTGD